MGEKYNRQIRKEINSTYKTCYNQIMTMCRAKMISANFFQRIKIAFKYVFKKDFEDFF
jgi:hypothetical protein